MNAVVQGAFDFCQRPVRARKPEQLFFALMPDESGAVLLAGLAGRILDDLGLDGVVRKPGRLFVALQRLGDDSDAVLFGAKLAGQAVAAAGLAIAFDTVAAERRVLALTSKSEALAAVHCDLAAAINRHGLRAEPGEPQIALADGVARLEPQPVKPLKLKVSGLALLRGDSENFQVLRRWPLNRSHLTRR